MTAAADPEVVAFTWRYVASAVGFVVALIVFCTAGVWLLDRLATRVYDRSVTRARRALANGDSAVRRAVEEIEAYANGEVSR